MFIAPVGVQARPPKVYCEMYPNQANSEWHFTYSWTSGILLEGGNPLRAWLYLWFAALPSDASEIKYHVYFSGGCFLENLLLFWRNNDNLRLGWIKAFNGWCPDGWYSFSLPYLMKDSGIKIEFVDLYGDYIGSSWHIKSHKISFYAREY